MSDEKKNSFSCSCKIPWTGEKCEKKIGKLLKFAGTLNCEKMEKTEKSC